MKDYLITILTRREVLIKDEVWKAESIEQAEKRVNDFLHDKEFKGKSDKNNILKKKEEFIGKNMLWMHIITKSGEMPGEVFFVSVEEENGTRWELKNA
jgi:hypothetical protein